MFIYIYILNAFYVQVVGFLDVFTKLRKVTISFIMSVSPSPWNNLAPTGRIFMKFDISDFSKICRENSSFIKTGHEQQVLYMKNNIHFLSYLPHFFLDKKCFRQM